MFRDLQLLRCPGTPVTVVNRGIGGNTVDDLRSRWREDVLLHRPDILFIKIGINDLNQSLTIENRAFLKPDGFRSIYRDLLRETLAELPETRVHLLSPFYLSADKREGSYRAKVAATLPAYIKAVAELAAEWKTGFLDLNAVFARQLQFHHPDVFCEEPVHPNATGHLLMAEAVWSFFQEEEEGEVPVPMKV